MCARLGCGCGTFAWMFLDSGDQTSSCASAMPASPTSDSKRVAFPMQDIVDASEVRCTARLCRSIPGKATRLFIDGAFDVINHGCMNPCLQTEALGSYLVVGVNSDQSLAEAKGLKPMLNDLERQRAVAACHLNDELISAPVHNVAGLRRGASGDS